MLAFRSILIGITNSTTVFTTSSAWRIRQIYLPVGVGFTLIKIVIIDFHYLEWH
ncbi:MAG: hypothetical protein ACSLEL_00590 [Candidatus Malihini olakiniferum]